VRGLADAFEPPTRNEFDEIIRITAAQRWRS
jgi:hypothetical protein